MTLVAYWGEEEWDGPKILHDMLDFGDGGKELDPEIKRLIPELPLHFLDLSRIEHPEYFETELRPFLELYKSRNNKEEFTNYIKFNEESNRMDSESWNILGELTHAKELIEKLRAKSEDIQEGKAEAIIELLEELGEVSKELRNKIYAKKDLEILKKWHKLSARVKSIKEFEEQTL